MEECMPLRQMGGRLGSGEERKSSEKDVHQQPREEPGMGGLSGKIVGTRYVLIAQGLGYRRLMHCGKSHKLVIRKILKYNTILYHVANKYTYI